MGNSGGYGNQSLPSMSNLFGGQQQQDPRSGFVFSNNTAGSSLDSNGMFLDQSRNMPSTMRAPTTPNGFPQSQPNFDFQSGSMNTRSASPQRMFEARDSGNPSSFDFDSRNRSPFTVRVVRDVTPPRGRRDDLGAPLMQAAPFVPKPGNSAFMPVTFGAVAQQPGGVDSREASVERLRPAMHISVRNVHNDPQQLPQYHLQPQHSPTTFPPQPQFNLHQQQMQPFSGQTMVPQPQGFQADPMNFRIMQPANNSNRNAGSSDPMMLDS